MRRKLPLITLHYYVGLSVVLFLIFEVLRWQTIAMPRNITSYLNDFLVIPIVSFIALRAVWFLKQDQSIRLTPLMILSLVVIFSLYFEVYLPKIYSRYVADIYDVCCYLGGGFVFYFLQKLP